MPGAFSLAKNIVLGQGVVLKHSGKDGKTGKCVSPTKIKPCLDAYSVFLKHIGSLLSCARLAGTRVTLNAAKDTLMSDSYRIIARNVMWYVCYDLAIQDDACAKYGEGSQNPNVHFELNTNVLMRFVAFAFACSLSSSQRKSVIKLLSDKITGNEAKSIKMNGFFRLLQIVDGFRQYLNPKDVDSLYMPAVESAVGLFADIVSKKQESAPNFKTLSLIRLLEAKFLLQIAEKSYEIVLSRKTIDRDLMRLCEENAHEISRLSGKLCSALDDLLCGKAHNISKEFFDSALSGIKVFRSGEQSGADTELMSGMETLLSQVKCLLREWVDAVSQNSDQQNSKLVMTTNNVTTSVSPVGLGLQNNKQIVDDVYDMVIRGSAGTVAASSTEKTPLQQYFFPSGILCSSTIAYHAKKFVYRLQSSKSRRFHGSLECTNIKIVLDALSRCEAINDIPCSISQEIKSHRAVFESLVKNIFISLALGDTRSVFGEDSGILNMNYRVLALYINMFCNLPPDMMKSSLTELKKFFEECGGELPPEVNNVLCLLIDLKYFSYKSSYTGNSKDYRNDCKKVHNRYYNKNQETAVGALTTLAKLSAYSACVNKNNRKPGTTGKPMQSYMVNLPDVVRVLLYECKLAVDVSLELDCGDSKKHKEKPYSPCNAKHVHRKVSEVLAGGKLATIESLISNKKTIGNKINKSVEKIRDVLLVRLGHDKTLGEKSAPCLTAVADDLLREIWNEKTNDDVSCSEMDKKLALYMISRSHTAVNNARHLVSVCEDIEGLSTKLPLGFVLDTYFRCSKTPGCDSAKNTHIPLHSSAELRSTTTSSTTNKVNRVRFDPTVVSQSVTVGEYVKNNASRILSAVHRNHTPSYAVAQNSVPQILDAVIVNSASAPPLQHRTGQRFM